MSGSFVFGSEFTAAEVVAFAAIAARRTDDGPLAIVHEFRSIVEAVRNAR